MPLSANRIWRQMPDDIRITAARIFWAESKGPEKQFLLASLAKTRKLREVTVRKTPVDRLANWTAATPSLPDPIVEDLLKQYLLHEHRAVIISFLELLKVPHSDGMIEESFDLSTLSTEQVQNAAGTLLQSADHGGAVLYLKYLVLQQGPWTAVEKVLPAGE